ncbi:FIVAR domain-containing protein [Pseudoflavonifractor capillosus]|uniref:right-handed parallel beta-helix repeat-containing protein n=1 Tax=Pseudoflavonifractor capillosus TaxID=106588 RepID=UPI00195B9987|nr:right-handed parallel beta-helix repeat-containing protein [Pseudoflavonifractor capillosus]MBM6695339.1 FIVAR domain-containing protein [Pseudoflavonifractor capillosus]
MLKKSLSLLLAGALTVSLAVPAVAGNSQAQPKKDTSYGTTYYLDASIGKTDGDGLTPANAFDSLEDVNAKTFQPGDQILIKAGTQYTGTLWPKGSGCEGYPIVIDMYGEGDKPLIDGNGAYFMPQVKDWQGPFTGQTGDQIGAAVYLYNQEYIEINNLEVKNQGDNVNRDRSGIRVEGYDYGVIDHIYIRNCYVHDVRGYNGQDDIYPVVPTNPDGSPTDGFTDEDQTNPNTTNTFWGARTTHRTGGINFVTYTARLPESKNEFNVPVQELDETRQITTFNDILIENNTVENCQANGITTTNVKGTLDDVAFRHTNVVIRGNDIHNVTRSGIIPIYTNGVLVEYNKVDTFQSTYEGYGCGIWCDRANGMVFQYNEVCNGVNGNDGMAFNLDDMTRDGVIQYNYTHDNYGGGYMLHVRQNSYNRNNTIRFNLSVNDSGVFTAHNAQIVAVGETSTTKLESAKVYNNTFLSNKDCHAVYQGDEVDYTNNIWYFTNSAVANRKDCFYPGANSSFDNNVYIGCVAPTDANQHTDDPQFVGGSNLFGLTRDQALVNASLTANSPYVGAGMAVEDNGGQDILGGSLDTLNLGAIAGAGHQAAAVSQTYTPNEVTKYLSDGTQQTQVIHETVSESNTKWVNTTFNSKSVIYTKKEGNYLEFDMVGTGGTFTLKRGGGAGNVKLVAYQGGQEVKSVTVNTYNATADTITVDDFAQLSETNEAYTIRVYNAENGKAANFVSFTTNVAETTQPGCDNDAIAGVVLEQPMAQVIPYGKTSVSVDLASHVYFRTCQAQQPQATVTYTANNGATVEGNTVTFPAPGDYTVTAQATYNEVTVTDTITVSVTQGQEPQVNVPAVDTRALTGLIAACEGLDLTKYGEARQDVFQQTLAQAKALLEGEGYTQAQVDEMVALLTTAKNGLSLTRVNAEDSVVVKNGNWVNLTDATLDGGKALKCSNANESMTVDFFGNQVQVYGRKAVGVAIMTFTVTRLSDNEVVHTQTVDGYNAEKLDQQELFAWTGEANDQYRLTITNTGTDNENANNSYNVIIDFLTFGCDQAQLADLTALAAALTKADGLNSADYTPEAWQAVEAAVLAGRRVYVDATATQAQVDAAAAALNEAMDNLSGEPEEPAFTGLLEKVYAEVAAQDYSNLIDSAKAYYEKALADAEAILNNPTAYTQEQVDEVTNRLFIANAMLGWEKGDPTMLQLLVERANQMKENADKYVSDNWQLLVDALADAEKILAEASDTMQGEMDEAADALLNAILAQRFKADKSVLEELVNRATQMVENADKYVETHWQELLDALTGAQAIMADQTLSEDDQAKVDEAADALLDAILAQRFKADKSILDDLINKAEGIDLEGYTAESVATFRTALQNAQAVMADETLSEEDQATVDAAVAALNAAMDGLTADGAPEVTDKPEATDQPEASQAPEATDKPEASQTPEATNQPQSTAKPQATQKPESVPETGDSSQLLVYVAALASAVLLLSTAVVVRKQTCR